MKKCIKCDKEKVLSEFHFRRDANNYRSECKECIKLKNKKYREENLDDIKKDELIKLNNYKNLRPLCSFENLKKSNKLLK